LVTGLLGGAFDPPHLGHVALAHEGKRRFGLDRLVVLVSDDPGHKAVETPAEARLALARAAFPDDEVVLDRHGRTIDLLRDGRYDGAIFLVGADEFATFLDWKEPEEVLEHVRLGVGSRPGYPRERLEAVRAHLARPERVELFEIGEWPVESRRLRAGEALEGSVPPAVARLARELGLYGEVEEASYTGTSTREEPGAT
jgi:nicotinate-nucleotide adenylyltransferase